MERRPLSVVVVDDDPLALKLVRSTLEPLGWEVHTCVGGQEAADLVRAVSPSVVVMDLLMPQVDGFAVIDELRPDRDSDGPPIVVLTAKSLTPQRPVATRGPHRLRRPEGRHRPGGSRASARGRRGVQHVARWRRRRGRRLMSRPPMVLLVEDNPRNVKLARDVLEYAGFVVVVAMTGEEGVEQSRTTLPDVILMDLQLPGHRRLRRARAHPRPR